MGSIELLIIAIGLSMDAFAVAICKGLSMEKMSYRNAVITGCFFGGFQALMPLLGYLLGTQFKDYITSIDHWIAFGLLSIIGINMIKEARNTCEVSDDDSFSLRSLTMMAFATSIDALAIGVTFAFLQVNIIPAVTMIGITTFTFSFLGVKIGNVFGAKFQSKAEMVGGFILIAMGCKILFEHLRIIPF
ncbi:manganese efflux pump MntP family protein [Acetivibrio straminisolvens]|jgi:putative Mn2+ efflux pump MntP|uniref:Putative manganese efflux pump MntP n=1 Tax=Acetivibrio straminisolvens JCM 21531 TaxID=1294263 RepID=W4V213_9FIRM|nr:manganese efflux pump MntP family protein [Acetivibrio straminisolvens]GAE87157.1 membrane protein [Acetivibrio straminisolvens JCM 21531]